MTELGHTGRGEARMRKASSRSSLGDEQHGGATRPKQTRERMSTEGGRAELRFEHVEHFQVGMYWAELVRAWLQRTAWVLG